MSIRDRFPSAKLPRSHYFLTISRGDIVYEDGRVNSTAGRGRFLPCERPFARKCSPAWEIPR